MKKILITDPSEYGSDGTDGLGAVIHNANQDAWNMLPHLVQAWWDATEDTVYCLPIVIAGVPTEIHLILPNCAGEQTEEKKKSATMFFAFAEGFFAGFKA